MAGVLRRTATHRPQLGDQLDTFSCFFLLFEDKNLLVAVRKRDHYETLAICRTLELARAAFAAAIAAKPAGCFMIRSWCSGILMPNGEGPRSDSLSSD